MKLSYRVISKSSLLPGATLKPIAQFKKTKSNRNVFGRSTGRSKGGSKNLLLGLTPKDQACEIRNKSQNLRDQNNIETETNDTNNDEIESSTPPMPNPLSKQPWDEENKESITHNIFVVEALDDADNAPIEEPTIKLPKKSKL